MSGETIPAEIAHLDFTPDEESKETPTGLRECTARRKDSQEKDCNRPARWKITFGCCKRFFYCCNAHKERGVKWDCWFCAGCSKERSTEWMGIEKL